MKEKSKITRSDSTNAIRMQQNALALMSVIPIIVFATTLVVLYISNTVNQNSEAESSSLLFDGSKTSYWEGKQWTSSCGSYIKDVSSVPSGKSGNSMEVFLKDGCYWNSTGTERVELSTSGGQLSFKEGTVWYIDFWQKFDQLAPHSGDWDIWLQTHYLGGGSQPNLIFSTDQSGRMKFKTSTGCGHQQQWLGSVIQTGKWYRFTLGTKFSSDKNVGWVELSIDGNNVLSRRGVATLGANPTTCSNGKSFDATKGYLKKGIYRNPSHSGDEKYTLYGLKVYSSNPLSQTIPLPTPTPSPTPTPTPIPTPTLPPAPSNPPIETPTVPIPGANTTDPVAIPENVQAEENGTIVADFTGDGLNDTAVDSNNDGQIDPRSEIAVDLNANATLDLYDENDNQLNYNQDPLDNTSITIKAGPLPETKISKPVAYTFITLQGIAALGLASYLAITKLTVFANIRGKLGL